MTTPPLYKGGSKSDAEGGDTLGAALLTLIDDPDPHVRMQLACTLGEWDDEHAGKALGRLALRAADDPYLATAVMSSVRAENIDQVLAVVLGEGGTSSEPADILPRLLTLATAVGTPETLHAVFSRLTTPQFEGDAGWRFMVLADVLDGLDRRRRPWTALQKDADGPLKAELDRLPGLFEAARRTVRDGQTDEPRRVATVRLLGRQSERREDDLRELAGLLVPQTSAAVQAAAVRRLGEFNDEMVASRLLSGWRTYSPAIRAQVMDVLFSRPAGIAALLEAVERKQVAGGDFDAARRQRLLQSRDADVRRRAEQLLAGAIDADRQKVIDAYRPALDLTADAVRGKAVFSRACAACHKLDGAGHEVGPDLASLADKPADYLLVHILDPNRVIESRYLNYIAVTTDGRTFSGLLAGESGNSLTLRAAEGKQQTLLRNEIEELASTGKSAMPEGLEKDLSPQDLADLLAYLKQSGP